MRVHSSSVLLLSACLLLAPAAGAESYQTTNGALHFDSATVEAELGNLGDIGARLPLAAGCDRTVGLLGSPFGDLVPSIESFGLTVLGLDASAIAGGALDSIDVLYVVRSGMFDATSEAATIDAWVRSGGVMITEFDSTTVFYSPGPLNYLSGTLASPFHFPSGTVCGGNTIVVNEPDHPLAEGLDSAWDCSGDPIGVLKVYAGIDPSLLVIASVSGSDADGDGVDDPVLAVADVDDGTIILFYSDFGDWTTLVDPRDCAGGAGSADCSRSVEDETLLANALCFDPGCGDCPALHETIDAMDIDVAGVRKSLHSQADAACKAAGKGQLKAAGNTLCALLNHDRAQFDKHVSADSAIVLENCVRAFAEANAISLDSGRCGSVVD